MTAGTLTVIEKRHIEPAAFVEIAKNIRAAVVSIYFRTSCALRVFGACLNTMLLCLVMTIAMVFSTFFLVRTVLQVITNIVVMTFMTNRTFCFHEVTHKDEANNEQEKDKAEYTDHLP